MPDPLESSAFLFDHAIVGDRWIENALITVSNGVIQSVESASSVADTQRIRGVALPGMINVHSHSFQRALAGRSEFRTAHQDSFWTWRAQMYDFVKQFQPDDVYRISLQLYRELLAGGYTSVGEFHYLHADQQGRPYSRINELSLAIAQAAADSGINFCYIPALYQQGGFGRPLEEGQSRFFLTEEQFFELIESTAKKFAGSKNFHVAMALHSLRAVNHTVGTRVVEQFRASYPNRPIHMHVAEQIKEVDDCLTATGKRSIEYLFDQYAVDQHWCLIHCTQALEHELQLIAESGAVVGLCPTTEANLGDGIFPAQEFLSLGGRIGIGTDSQVSGNPAAELRQLEYSQRLRLRQRCVLATTEQSVGRRLFDAVTAGGAQALGISGGSLEVGQRADLIVIDPRHPSIGGELQDRLLDRWAFCDYGNPVMRTMVGGAWI
jgi:formimidoylglutamate deiminase